MPHSATNNDKFPKRRSSSVTNREQKQSNVSTSTTPFISSPRQHESRRPKMPAVGSNTTTSRRSVPVILPSRYIVQYY